MASDDLSISAFQTVWAQAVRPNIPNGTLIRLLDEFLSIFLSFRSKDERYLRIIIIGFF